jgi:hypothetical protein
MTLETPAEMEARVAALAELPLERRVGALDELHDELKGFLEQPSAP